MGEVTIITVSLDSKKTIERTIKSVIEQTYPDIEYIVVDGGSTDGTVDIIKKYESNISVWVSEPDKGIYDAINKGIMMSTGEIIGIINSDDWYERDAVENAVIAMEKNNAEMVCGNVVMHYKSGKSRILSPRLNEDPLYGNIIPHPSVFARSALYEEEGLYDVNYSIAADYKWMMGCIKKKHKIVCLDKAIAHFSDGGVSNTYHYDTIFQSAKIVKEFLDSLNSSVNSEEIINYWNERIQRAKGDDEMHRGSKKTISYLQRILKEPVVVWGTGHYGELMSGLLEQAQIKIDSFLDSDSSKVGSRFMDYSIKEPGSDLKGKQLLIAIDMPDDEMIKLIESKGYNCSECISIRQLQREIGRD